MTLEALTRMHNELKLVRKELETIERFCQLIRPSVVAYGVAGEPKLRLGPEAQEYLTRLRAYQEERRLLGPRPTFPHQL